MLKALEHGTSWRVRTGGSCARASRQELRLFPWRTGRSGSVSAGLDPITGLGLPLNRRCCPPRRRPAMPAAAPRFASRARTSCREERHVTGAGHHVRDGSENALNSVCRSTRQSPIRDRQANWLQLLGLILTKCQNAVRRSGFALPIGIPSALNSAVAADVLRPRPGEDRISLAFVDAPVLREAVSVTEDLRGQFTPSELVGTTAVVGPHVHITRSSDDAGALLEATTALS